MGPGPRYSWVFFDLSVKLYDNDYAKDVNFLQHIQSPVEMFEGRPIIFDG